MTPEIEVKLEAMAAGLNVMGELLEALAAKVEHQSKAAEQALAGLVAMRQTTDAHIEYIAEQLQLVSDLQGLHGRRLDELSALPQQDGEMAVKSITIRNAKGRPVIILSADDGDHGRITINDRGGVQRVVLRCLLDYGICQLHAPRRSEYVIMGHPAFPGAVRLDE